MRKSGNFAGGTRHPEHGSVKGSQGMRNSPLFVMIRHHYLANHWAYARTVMLPTCRDRARLLSNHLLGVLGDCRSFGPRAHAIVRHHSSSCIVTRQRTSKSIIIGCSPDMRDYEHVSTSSTGAAERPQSIANAVIVLQQRHVIAR